MAHTVNTLLALRERLTPKDMEILHTLEGTHCLFTHQVTRLFYDSASTDAAASKACRRALTKLLNHKLLDRLDRRIGGFKAGSSAHIWYLTDAGYKLLDLENPDKPVRRRRFIEPSSLTLRRRLTSAECYVQMVELSRKTDITIRRVEFEPSCWTQYPHNGKNKTLKSDIFMAIGKGEYEYLYYIEIDLASESMTDIIRQCERYHDFYNSNLAQDAYGIFPTVLWIVPDKKRKALFQQKLGEQYQKTNHLFCIITADELAEFMTKDTDSTTLI